MNTSFTHRYIAASLLLGGMLICLASGATVAKQVTLDVALDKPLLLAETPQIAHVRVGLTGFAWDGDRERSPVNVAIVLDKSGSMDGTRLEMKSSGRVVEVVCSMQP